MFDFLPAGFDANDALFYSALLIAVGYAVLFATRRVRHADLEDGWLDLEAAAFDLEDATTASSAPNRIR